MLWVCKSCGGWCWSRQKTHFTRDTRCFGVVVVPRSVWCASWQKSRYITHFAEKTEKKRSLSQRRRKKYTDKHTKFKYVCMSSCCRYINTHTLQTQCQGKKILCIFIGEKCDESFTLHTLRAYTCSRHDSQCGTSVPSTEPKGASRMVSN